MSRFRSHVEAWTTTVANVNDVTWTLAVVDGIPPVAGWVGHPRKHPEALFGDKDYDSSPNCRELRKRRILPVISRRSEPDIICLASSATSSSRLSPNSTSSSALPPAASDVSTSTTPSSHSPAHSSADDAPPTALMIVFSARGR